MVKNKALLDSARLCQTLQTPPSGHSLSLSPSQIWPSQGWSCVFLSRRHRSSWGYPLDPAEAGPQHRTKRGASACSSPSFTALLSHPSTATRIMLLWEHLPPARGVNRAFHQPLKNGHVTLHSTQLKGNLSLCDSEVHSQFLYLSMYPHLGLPKLRLKVGTSRTL